MPVRRNRVCTDNAGAETSNCKGIPEKK